MDDYGDRSFTDNIHHIFFQAQQLESLTLNTPVSSWDDDSWPDGDYIIASALRHLLVFSWNPPIFLCHLTAPALESLRIRVEGAEDYAGEFAEADAHLTGFIERSSPPLRELYMTEVVLSSNLYISIFLTLHKLEVLRLVEVDIPEDALQLLLSPVDDSDTWACPRLRSFSASHAPVAYFLRLLEARNPPSGSSPGSNMRVRLTHIGCSLSIQEMEAISTVLGSYPTNVYHDDKAL